MDCVNWLKEYLGRDSLECEFVKEAAKRAGYSKEELRAARKILGVKTWHQFDRTEEPFIENWFWYLLREE